MRHPINTQMIAEMAHERVRNYVVPGLESHLLLPPSARGALRLFKNTRTQHHHITPHNHRFDFQCFVMRGWAIHDVYKPYNVHSAISSDNEEMYRGVEQTYNGAIGNYTMTDGEVSLWEFRRTKYEEGDWYGLRAEQVHSVVFSPDAEVLFIEGPIRQSSTTVLLPHVDGQTAYTMRVEPWMFRRDDH